MGQESGAAKESLPADEECSCVLLRRVAVAEESEPVIGELNCGGKPIIASTNCGLRTAPVRPASEVASLWWEPMTAWVESEFADIDALPLLFGPFQSEEVGVDHVLTAVARPSPLFADAPLRLWLPLSVGVGHNTAAARFRFPRL